MKTFYTIASQNRSKHVCARGFGRHWHHDPRHASVYRFETFAHANAMKSMLEVEHGHVVEHAGDGAEPDATATGETLHETLAAILALGRKLYDVLAPSDAFTPPYVGGYVRAHAGVNCGRSGKVVWIGRVVNHGRSLPVGAMCCVFVDADGDKFSNALENVHAIPGKDTF